MRDWTSAVEIQLKHLTKPQRKLSIEDKCRLISARILQGWAFLGTSLEKHNQDVAEISEVVKRLTAEN